ncbi:MAG: hypothetical protein HKN54_05605 [Flavobacteriaceae bacterium]|nr:hypothetical protein [Flavobacteriaceae bacterium]
MNQKVNWFFEKDTNWQKEYQKLRAILLDCGLTEELKWGCPCYTLKTNNVVLIHGFKEYCALLFHKGVLLNDSNNILIQQTENVQSARQIRFTNLDEIDELEQTIKAYVFEAIEVEKAGLKVELKKTNEYTIPAEFQKSLNDNPDLESAFKALTPGRQRGYLLHFSQPKQSKTRQSRIEKCMPKILIGEGLNDNYKVQKK